MRVVFDSNVLVAAFGTQGLCHILFELALRRHQVVVSEQILREVAQALGRKIKLPSRINREIRAYLEAHCLVERPVPVPRDACRDPDDLNILGVAAAAQAECLVTGDSDLLTLKRYHETRILSPRQLHDLLRSIPAP